MQLAEIKALMPDHNGYIEYNGKVYHKETLLRVMAKKKEPAKIPIIATKKGEPTLEFPNRTQAANFFECCKTRINKALQLGSHKVNGYSLGYKELN